MSIKINFPKLRVQCLLIGILLLIATDLAWAQALPWEDPLNKLRASLTGPIAKAIGVIALAAAGGMLAFGGELGDFTKRILMVVMATAVLILAGGFMDSLGLG